MKKKDYKEKYSKKVNKKPVGTKKNDMNPVSWTKGNEVFI